MSGCGVFGFQSLHFVVGQKRPVKIRLELVTLASSLKASGTTTPMALFLDAFVRFHCSKRVGFD